MSFGCTDSCRQPSGNQCHCTVCHHTFRHLSNFDGHRRGSINARCCVEPAEMGLIERGGIWATIESHEKASTAGVRLADSRASGPRTDALNG